MGFLSKLLGTGNRAKEEVDELLDLSSWKSGISLQVLFARPFSFDPEAVARTLREIGDETRRASCRVLEPFAERGTIFGLAGWGSHAVRLIGFDAPMPAAATEACLAPAHFAKDFKDRARAHAGHLLLYYAGREASRLEQYVVLAAIAGALARHGAIAVLNEAAQTAVPAEMLAPGAAGPGTDQLELLRELPLPALYVGLVKYDVEGAAGVWMRTHGAHLLGLADLAHLAPGHEHGTRVFDIFANVLAYQLSSGAELAAGHTMEVGEDTFMKLRAPTKEEYFLQSEGKLVVAEFATASEMNR